MMQIRYDSAKEEKNFQRIVSSAINSLMKLKRVEGKMFPQSDQDALDLALLISYEDWKKNSEEKKG